ncbi:MAG TPA: BlaI/MecI/CopY family transcriptional regulator [Patescibacteria group bacterium]|jgi:predicted transcriptional regulator|nr:BlaI/MecI/CopY family transcriptional regulator [Patescibacteria group bacterium]
MEQHSQLSRRERQIMDVLHANGEATVAQIAEALPNPPTTMAVRRMLHILFEKGMLKRHQNSREMVYAPREPRQKAGASALQRVLEVFFGGSLEEAVATHLLSRKAHLSKEERERLLKLIEQARK